MKRILLTLWISCYITSAYADMSDILCPRAMTQAESYLDALQNKMIAAGDPAERRHIARTEWLEYQKAQNVATQAELKRSDLRGSDLEKTQTSLKTLDKLNVLHYEFFGCTLITEPRKSKVDLLKEGYNYCRRITSGSPRLKCLAN